jgi:hypothetical protein
LASFVAVLIVSILAFSPLFRTFFWSAIRLSATFILFVFQIWGSRAFSDSAHPSYSQRLTKWTDEKIQHLKDRVQSSRREKTLLEKKKEELKEKRRKKNGGQSTSTSITPIQQRNDQSTGTEAPLSTSTQPPLRIRKRTEPDLEQGKEFLLTKAEGSGIHRRSATR